MNKLIKIISIAIITCLACTFTYAASRSLVLERRSSSNINPEAIVEEAMQKTLSYVYLNYLPNTGDDFVGLVDVESGDDEPITHTELQLNSKNSPVTIIAENNSIHLEADGNINLSSTSGDIDMLSCVNFKDGLVTDELVLGPSDGWFRLYTDHEGTDFVELFTDQRRLKIYSDDRMDIASPTAVSISGDVEFPDGANFNSLVTTQLTLGTNAPITNWDGFARKTNEIFVIGNNNSILFITEDNQEIAALDHDPATGGNGISAFFGESSEYVSIGNNANQIEIADDNTSTFTINANPVFTGTPTFETGIVAKINNTCYEYAIINEDDENDDGIDDKEIHYGEELERAYFGLYTRRSDFAWHAEYAFFAQDAGKAMFGDQAMDIQFGSSAATQAVVYATEIKLNGETKTTFQPSSRVITSSETDIVSTDDFLWMDGDNVASGVTEQIINLVDLNDVACSTVTIRHLGDNNVPTILRRVVDANGHWATPGSAEAVSTNTYTLNGIDTAITCDWLGAKNKWYWR